MRWMGDDRESICRLVAWLGRAVGSRSGRLDGPPGLGKMMQGIFHRIASIRNGSLAHPSCPASKLLTYSDILVRIRGRCVCFAQLIANGTMAKLPAPCMTVSPEPVRTIGEIASTLMLNG